MDAIEPSNYEQAGWSDLTYEYVQALRTALDAEKARADAAEAERDRVAAEWAETSQRNYQRALAAEDQRDRLRQWWETAIVERDAYSEERDAAEAALKTAREDALREAAGKSQAHAEHARKMLGRAETRQEAADWALIVTRADLITDAILALIKEPRK